VDVCLLSRRGGAGGHWSQQLARVAAEALSASGCRVRWLCALTLDEPLPSAHGIELLPVRGRVAPFRRVHGRLTDTAMDIALARSLRHRPADIVHDLGLGAPGSASMLWLAERMGATGVATVRAAEVLCHRQTLIDWQQRDCRVFDDPARCTLCCLTASTGALSPAGAMAGRALSWLRGLSPFPNRHAFATRFDVVVGGLGSASLVLVEHATEAELLVAAGVRARAMRSGNLAEAHGPVLARAYAELLAD
jgi:hypothetical protein